MARTAIDFNAGLTKAEVINRDNSGHTSPWVHALAELNAGVESGHGEYGVLYKIGEFGNASGAQTTIRNLRKRDDLPGAFELQAVVVNVEDADGLPVYVEKTVKDKDTGKEVTKSVPKRVSELWAAVVDPDEPPENDDDEAPENEG